MKIYVVQAKSHYDCCQLLHVSDNYKKALKSLKDNVDEIYATDHYLELTVWIDGVKSENDPQSIREYSKKKVFQICSRGGV